MEVRQGAVGRGGAGRGVVRRPVAAGVEDPGAEEAPAVAHLEVVAADTLAPARPQHPLPVEPAAAVRGLELVPEAALDQSAVGPQAEPVPRDEHLVRPVGPVRLVGGGVAVAGAPADEELPADVVDGVRGRLVRHLEGAGRACARGVDGHGTAAAEDGEDGPGAGDAEGVGRVERF